MLSGLGLAGVYLPNHYHQYEKTSDRYSLNLSLPPPTKFLAPRILQGGNKQIAGAVH
jgi:hypothetical protein